MVYLILQLKNKTHWLIFCHLPLIHHAQMSYRCASFMIFLFQSQIQFTHFPTRSPLGGEEELLDLRICKEHWIVACLFTRSQKYIPFSACCKVAYPHKLVATWMRILWTLPFFYSFCFLSLAIASRKYARSLVQQSLVYTCPKFWVVVCTLLYISIVGSWWSQWWVMAACHGY